MKVETMKNLTYAIYLLILFLAVPLVYGQEDTDEAAIGEEQATLLVRPVPTLTAGENLTVEALLLDQSTRPLAGMTLIVYVDSEERARVQTDAEGAIEVGLGNRYEFGTYTITVEFAGNESYAPVSSTRMLTVTEVGMTTNAEVPINPPQLLVGRFPYLTVGESVLVDVLMLNNIGVPIPNMPIIVYVNGEQRRRARTDEEGRAVIGLGNDFGPDTYDIVVEFVGTRAYNSVSVQTTLTINQIGLTLQTIPPLPYVEFVFNGTTVTTDETGLLTVYVSEPGIYNLEAIPLENDLATPDTRAVFQRWSDSVFEPGRTVELKRNKYLEAGFIISHPMSMSFIDLDGEPVDQSRITTITLKTSKGDRLVFDDGQTRWLQATRINRRREGLEATPILYSVEDVTVDGSNVINRYQQRFLVEANANMEIQLLLYYAHIESRDALFGFPVGTGVNVGLPSGELVYYPYDESGSVYIGPLGRGTYTVQPVNIGGMVPVTPMALSRDQVVSLMVLSVFDMVVAVSVGVFGSLGLLLYGRPQLIWLPVKMLKAIPASPLAHPRRAFAEAFNALRLKALPVMPTVVVSPAIRQPQPMHQMTTAPVSYVKVPALALNAEEIRELEELRFAALDEVIRKRCDIILLSNKQIPPEKVAEQLNLSSVSYYVSRYRYEGIVGIFNKAIYDISENYLEDLRLTVRTHPKEFGCSFPAWTAESLSVIMTGRTGDYIPAEVLEEYMTQEGWYSMYADFEETEPSVDLMPKLVRSKVKQTEASNDDEAGSAN
jgi:hypothetical protein